MVDLSKTENGSVDPSDASELNLKVADETDNDQQVHASYTVQTSEY